MVCCSIYIPQCCRETIWLFREYPKFSDCNRIKGPGRPWPPISRLNDEIKSSWIQKAGCTFRKTRRRFWPSTMQQWMPMMLRHYTYRQKLRALTMCTYRLGARYYRRKLLALGRESDLKQTYETLQNLGSNNISISAQLTNQTNQYLPALSSSFGSS